MKGEYHALLIATDEYKEWKPLKNPINDARSIEKELATRYGFKTRLVPNPDVETFSKVIADLKGMRFGPDDELFIFIAGHGTFDEGEEAGYLIAKDSHVDEPSHGSQIKEGWIPDVLRGLKAPHVLIVIDASQSGAEMLTRSDTKPDLTYAAHEKLKVILAKKSKRPGFT